VREYGALDLVLTITTLLNWGLTLGLDYATFRYYYSEDSLVGRHEVLATVFWSMLAIATLGAALLIPAAPLISRFILSSVEFRNTTVAAMMTLPLYAIHAYTLTHVRVENKPIQSVVLSVTAAFATA